jgi:hypothetical protein
MQSSCCGTVEIEVPVSFKDKSLLEPTGDAEAEHHIVDTGEIRLPHTGEIATITLRQLMEAEIKGK